MIEAEREFQMCSKYISELQFLRGELHGLLRMMDNNKRIIEHALERVEKATGFPMTMETWQNASLRQAEERHQRKRDA